MARFTLPRDLYHGKGALEELKHFEGKKAVVCVGGGSMKRFGFLDRAVGYLKEAGMEVELIEGIESDPSVETVMKGAQKMIEFQPDWIIAMGGGSPIDAAKAMWIKYEYPDVTFEDMCKVFGLPKLRQKAHFCAISSTSGTATEVTAFSIITDYQKGIKYPIADFEITPDVAIVDPDLAETMPKKLVAHTGMDAMTHAIEAYVSTAHCDYTDPLDSMPNYLSLLRSYGVTPLSGIVVDPGAYHENPLAIVPYMEELDMTQSLISSGMDVLLMPAACAFETPGEPDHSLTTGTVLKTSDQSYLRDLSDGIDSVDQQPGDRSGELSVALYAHRMHANGNISRLFIAGSSGLFTEEYVYQRTYVQQFIIMLMGQLLSDKIVTLDIMASAAVRPSSSIRRQGVRYGSRIPRIFPVRVSSLMASSTCCSGSEPGGAPSSARISSPGVFTRRTHALRR